MERKIYRFKIAAILIIFGLIMFSIGFALGVNTTIHKGVSTALVFMERGDLNISYNQELIESLIRRYASSAKLN